MPATVSYDDTTRTATLTPTGNLAYSTAYTASLASSIRALDGKPLGAPVTWSFTVANPVRPQVTSVFPADGATDIGAAVEAARDLLEVARPDDDHCLDVHADRPGWSGARDGRLRRHDQDGDHDPERCVDGRCLLHRPPRRGDCRDRRRDARIADDLAVHGLGTAAAAHHHVDGPAAGATSAPRTGAVSATFSRSMDPATPDDLVVHARTRRGRGSSCRDGHLQQRHEDGHLAADRDARSIDRLHGPGRRHRQGRRRNRARGSRHVDLHDGRLPVPALLAAPRAGRHRSADAGRAHRRRPWSYELGVKVTVDVPTDLNAIRFYKTAGETGTHIGRLWTSSGVLLAQVTFTGETASGWQQQAFASAPVLQPGAVYVLSVNANALFSVTGAGLAAPITAGPLSTVADGANGVYGPSAGTFPTASYNSSNYFIDASVVPDGDPAPPPSRRSRRPAVQPASRRSTAVTATFSRAIDPTTLTVDELQAHRPVGHGARQASPTTRPRARPP